MVLQIPSVCGGLQSKQYHKPNKLPKEQKQPLQPQKPLGSS